MVKVSMKDSAPTYVIKLRTGDVVVGNFGSVWGIGATLYRAEESLGTVAGASPDSFDWRVTPQQGQCSVELLAALALIHGQVAYN